MLEHLMAVMCPQFRADVLVPTADDPILGSVPCRVPACDRLSVLRGLCGGHRHRQRWRDEGEVPLEQWLVTTSPLLKGRQVLQSCCVAGCHYGRGRRGLCTLHHRQCARSTSTASRSRWSATTRSARPPGPRPLSIGPDTPCPTATAPCRCRRAAPPSTAVSAAPFPHHQRVPLTAPRTHRPDPTAHRDRGSQWAVPQSRVQHSAARPSSTPWSLGSNALPPLAAQPLAATLMSRRQTDMPAESSRAQHPVAAAAARRRASTRRRASEALQRMHGAGRPVTFETVAADADVSRVWLYNELDRAMIRTCGWPSAR